MSWSVSGDYVESCNCDVLCPCITSQGTAEPTQGYCDVVGGVAIERGQFDGVDLSGLNIAMMLHGEGPMTNGNIRGEIVLDASASAPQRAALETLFSGKAGGAPAALLQFMPNFLGFRTAHITMSHEGDTRRMVIDGVGAQEVSTLPGMGGETLVLTKTGHPVADDLALARAGQATFHDDNFKFDNTGKNGHVARVEWKG